jgi:hypothetical protein
MIMVVKVRQNETKPPMLESWDILSAKSPWVVIGHSEMLEWLVHDKADVVRGTWCVVYLFFKILKRCMFVPEVALGSYGVWNVDYKDVSKEDKKG